MEQRKKKTATEYIGSITVDSGIVQLGDPCYDAQLPSNITDAEVTDGVFYATQEREGGAYDDFPAAIAVQSGWGDGIYDVFIKRCKETGRVLELKIKFDLPKA